MTTQPVGTNGPVVSRIGFGCMGLGGDWTDAPLSARAVDQAREVVEAALQAGFTLFDHADIYTRGKAEETFGELLKQQPGLRQSMVIQSKCGIRFADTPEPGAPGRYDFSYDYIIQAVNASLRRLGTDYLDILLLHRPDPLCEPEEVARAIEQLHSQGKVLHFGVSNHNWAQIQLLESTLTRPLVVNQIEMSLAHYGFVEAGVSLNQFSPRYPQGLEGTLEYCRRRGIQLQAWSPLAQGYLTGRPLDDQHAHLAQVAELVGRYAQQHGVAEEAIALAWLLRHPGAIVPIIGTTNIARINACAQADQVRLSREEWYHLYTAARGAVMP
ncbi:aldo/keto reductase [Spirochaeta lutea]|uniref:Aldo/keto reductase n=1 Tax=Spirochaeta lutea TaxID=1480694 RepID=A0A098QWB3_9SPIO|nr:aldo/keto reductase [Spirochaeta lutea]KGE70792.1 aldo/keto reductase [Spirochaeta lutea]